MLGFLVMQLMMAWRRVVAVALIGGAAAYLFGGWPWLGAYGAVAILLWIAFNRYLAGLPPRTFDQVAQLALFRSLKGAFQERGMTEDEASRKAAEEVVRYLGPNALHDPEHIRWMVRRHGESHLETYPADVQEAYHRYWSKAPGEPRYGLLVRPLAGETEEEQASDWELFEKCSDLATADRRRAEMNSQATRQGLPHRFVIAPLV